MGYSLQLGAWSSVFAVPGALIDHYIKIADGDQLKVILWLLRHNGRSYSAEEIADGTGITPQSAEQAIRFWVQNELLAQENDVLSSTLRPAAPTDAPQAAPAPAVQTNPVPAAPRRMLRPDGIYISERVEASPSIRRLVEEAEAMLGKTLSPALSGTLIQAHEDYGLPCEVILMLVAYANKIGRANTSYIESTVRNWADSNILSIEAAEEKIRELDETAVAWKRCESAFGMTSRRAPSKNESQYAHRWIIEWKMPDELLNEAYNRCVDNTGKVNMKYINAVLERWYNAGIRTLKDAVDEKIAADARRETKRSPSYDLDAYEKYDIFSSNK
ncbi:MAG: DnaD domain protein [Clostridia bacterium]|nr:DnaD domain protein [Clostridia bacterium]